MVDLERLCKMMNNRPILKPNFYLVVVATSLFSG
jgi:hypothetical protein